LKTLQGNICSLRALEPEDLDFLYRLENNESIWEVSSTQTPYSKYVLRQYLANSHQDIYEAKQLRLVIEYQKKAAGLIDLFDYNPQHQRVGIGILVIKQFQQNGLATEALKLLINYVFKNLNIHQIYANILSDNKISIELFSKLNFKKVGIKKEWIKVEKTYKDEYLFQLINN